MTTTIHQKLFQRMRGLGLSRISIAIALFTVVGVIGWRLQVSSARIGNAGEPVQDETSATSVHPAPKTHTLSSLGTTTQFSISIRKPEAAPRVVTGIVDAKGESVTVACSTCHANRKPNQDNKVAADLDEFHQGMTLAHGKIACLACHNANDYDSLKLADGSQIEFQEVMVLCSQCHGTQRRDFDHGAHGGMTGHWDLNRGSRTRNNCVDCHHPHRPQFPKMQPTFKPRDRFLSPQTGVSDEHG